MGVEKVVLGIILIATSLYYIGTNTFNSFNDLKVVVNGAVPLLVLFFGLIVVWLQLDEMAVERKVSKRKK